jgi:hypothetical protein
MREVCLRLAFFMPEELVPEKDRELQKKLVELQNSFQKIRGKAETARYSIRPMSARLRKLWEDVQNDEKSELHTPELTPAEGWVFLEHIEGDNGTEAPYSKKYPHKKRYQFLNDPLVEKTTLRYNIKQGKKRVEKNVPVYRLKPDMGGTIELKQRLLKYFDDEPSLLLSDYARKYYDPRLYGAKIHITELAKTFEAMKEIIDFLPEYASDDSIREQIEERWNSSIKLIQKNMTIIDKSVKDAILMNKERMKHRKSVGNATTK